MTGSRVIKKLPVDNLSPIQKRVFSVFMDTGGNQADFAKDIGLSQSYISRVLRGEYEVTDRVIIPICRKLGYSPAWLVLGEGPKKIKVDKKSSTLLVEIQMLRTDSELVKAYVQRLEARMKAYEEKTDPVPKNVPKPIKKNG